MNDKPVYYNTRKHVECELSPTPIHQLLNRPSPQVKALAKKLEHHSKYLRGDESSPNLHYIAGYLMPRKYMEHHIISFGASGTGKSWLLKGALDSTLKQCTQGSGIKVVIADTKGDILPIAAFHAQKNGVPLYYINIHDDRSINPKDGIAGYAWDIAKDAEGRGEYFAELLSIFLPIPKNTDPFWQQLSQKVLMAGILYCEQIKPGKWGLHDLKNFISADLKELESILEQTPQGRSVKQYLFNGENDKVQGSTLINLQASFFNLEIAANHQYYTPKERWFSTKEFLKGEGILVLGQDISARASSNPIIQAIFRTLLNNINLRPDRLPHESPDIFFSLDEFPFLGRLPGIEEVLTFQRSKGVSAYLSAQDLNQLQETYGNHLANTITNNCDIKIFCRTNCNLTADWSVKLFGERRIWEESQSFTESPTSKSVTYNRQRTQRTRYTTDTFLNLPNADKTNGIHFHFLSPYTRNYTSYCVLDPEKVEKLKPQTLNIPSLIRKHPKYSQTPTLEEQAQQWAAQRVNENLHNPDWIKQYLSVKNPADRSLRTDILHFIQAEIQRLFGELLPRP